MYSAIVWEEKLCLCTRSRRNERALYNCLDPPKLDSVGSSAGIMELLHNYNCYIHFRSVGLLSVSVSRGEIPLLRSRWCHVAEPGCTFDKRALKRSERKDTIQHNMNKSHNASDCALE